MEVISFKTDKTLLNDIDSAVANGKYSTRTELIRDSIRRRLTDLEKEAAIKRLTEMKGFLKGKAIRTEEEVDRIINERLEKEAEAIILKKRKSS